MARRPNIAQILQDQDITALEEAMRFGQDADVRRKAVQGAGKLGNNKLIEALNRSLREDPDEKVQQEAYKALKEILGNNTEQVIATYNTGPVYEDEWILNEPEEIEDEIGEEWQVSSPVGSIAERPNFAQILKEQDITALEEAMRFGPDVKVRQLAARAAGQWGNYEMIEALTRSLREDPEEVVRKQAGEALYEMLGNRSDEVIASYNYGANYEDEWIVDEPEEAVDEETAGEWGESSINALYTMANDNRDITKSIKAVRALGQISSTRAVETLISICLNADAEKTRAEAREVLLSFYGDDLEDVLASYRLMDDEETDEYDETYDETVESSEEEEVTGDDADAQEEWQDTPDPGVSIRKINVLSPSVLQEEKINVAQIVLVVVGVMVVVGMVVLALGR